MSVVMPALGDRPYLLQFDELREVRSALRDAGFKVLDADASASTDERSLLTVIGDALAFPDYYVNPNWNAFLDCVGSLDLYEDGCITVIVLGADTLLRADLAAFLRSIHLLTQTTEGFELEQSAVRVEFLFAGDWRLGR